MGFIPGEVITQVLDRHDIVEVIASYVPLKPAGRNFKTTCPFHHEKTPSFVVSPDKQIYHCFGCGAGGNVVSFIMQQERLEFPEAVRFLAQKAGIEIPDESREGKPAEKIRQQLFKIHELSADYFHKNLLSDRTKKTEAARTYLKARGVNLDITQKFHLGFSLDRWDGLVNHLKSQGIALSFMEKAGLIIPQNKGDGFYDRFRSRIMFPIFDVKSRCIAFGGRTLEAGDSAKYVNSPETAIYTKGQHLYGLNWAKDAIVRKDCVIVVEGYMDFIMPFQSGIENIIASLGTAFTVEQIRLLRRYTHNVVMLFDSDLAGQAAMLRGIDALLEEGMTVHVAALSEGDDPDTFVRRYGVEKFQQAVDGAESLFDFQLRSLIDRYGEQAVEQKAKVATEMLATVNKFQNAIVKAEYMKKLSQRLGLSPEALLEESRKVSGEQEKSRRGITAVRNENARPDIRPVEKNLVRLTLEEEDFIPLLKAETSLTDFQNSHVRTILKKVFELFEQRQIINPSYLMSCLDDRRISEILSHIMSADEGFAGDRKKIFQDCIHRLKEERLKGRMREIRRQMEAAAQDGNQEQMEELTKEFNQLIKR